MIFLEVFNYNFRFFVYNFFFLKERFYEIDQGTLYGFSNENGVLISEHNDPNLTIRDIDKRVKYITLHCTNPNPDALSQVFYRKQDRDWADINSVTFKLDQPETTIYLPRTTKVTSLRFDLTDLEGDEILCQGITINPVMRFKLSYLRLGLLILLILGLIFGHKFIPEHVSETVWSVFINNGIWVFILLIILIDTTYPVTITYDSGHYLWLADMIKRGDYTNWDVIRNIGYPMILFLSTSILGSTQEALVIPLIISHVIFFVFAVQITLEVLQIKNKELRLLMTFIIFLLIGLDPTVVGYFHTLLTEYAGATIAVLSSYVAIKLYQTDLFSKKFFAYSAYYLLVVPIAWHIKQPYFGAAFFPFFIVCALIIFRKFSIKTLGFGLIVNIIIIAIVLLSNSAWNSFLDNHANPMDEDRQFSTYAEKRIDNSIKYTQQNPMDMVDFMVNRYIASTNYRRFVAKDELGKPSWTGAFQNSLIAHRMFRNYGAPNIVFKSGFYSQFANPFKTTYTPIRWLNNLFLMRILASNFLFISTFIFLPFFTLIWLIVWIINKSYFNAAILILTGTSLLNAIAHLLASPIDRYLFLGYPLNLLAMLLLVVKLIEFVRTRLLPTLIQKH
jgi:hypothetical protein